MAIKRAISMVKAPRDEKRMRFEDAVGRDYFDALSDDLIISVLIKIAASAKAPSDLIGLMSSCKRMNRLGMDPEVLRNASCYAFSIPATSWCNQAHQFLSRCANAGNMDASYLLGMIEFYCLGHYARGTDLLVRAAQASHAEALYSLAVIQFTRNGNNSGPCCHRDLEDPAALCAKSAALGHRDAITEISYCFWSCANMPLPPDWIDCLFVEEDEMEENEVESDGDRNKPRLYMQHGRPAHPASLFLTEGWQLPHVKNKTETDGLEICSRLCGRRETWKHQFYRCSCKKKFYCSHACQDVHWDAEHHATCDLSMVEY